MREFQSAEELLAHYDAVRERLMGRRTPPKVTIVPKEPDEEKTAPEPSEEILKASLPPLIINPTIAMPPPDFVEPPKNRIHWGEIVALVEKETKVSKAEILGPRRVIPIIRARHLLWALAYVCAPHLSIAQIGRLSDRDHTTILHGYKKGQEHPLYEKLRAELLSRLPSDPDNRGWGV